MKAHESIDFLQGNRLLISFFAVVWAPFFMYFFSRYTKLLFDIELPLEGGSYDFLTLVSFLQGIGCIPIIFVKTQDWPKLVGFINRVMIVIVLVGAAPWLILIFLALYQSASVYVIFTWFYCIVGLVNILYFVFYIVPVLRLDASEFFSLPT